MPLKKFNNSTGNSEVVEVTMSILGYNNVERAISNINSSETNIALYENAKTKLLLYVVSFTLF